MATRIGTIESYRKGVDAEQAFACLAMSAGYWVTKANDKDDKQGYDFVISRKGVSSKVEVKSYKGKHADEFLLELKGITGHEGWLFKSADLIAFQVESGFVLAERNKLIGLTTGKATYHRDSRPQEAVVFVPRSDVEAIATGVLR